MIADAVETSAAGGLAVLGLPQCLWTGSVAAVGDLLVQDGAVAPGVICDEDRWLALSGDTCQVVGARCGYNSIGFFASESSYATGRSPGCRVAEFKTLVRELHRAGVKVILDVVHNHSGEGNEMGPTLPFRGLDNPSYYSLTGPPEAPGYYMNYTGCGNSLRFESPAVIRLVMD